MLELSFLGGFEARRKPGGAIVLPTRKSRALLSYLALHPDEPAPRETLVGLLWSDRAEPQAYNSLSQSVTALRKALADVTPQPLIIETASLTLVGAHATVDVLEFEQMASQDSLAGLEQAERLYRGDFLAGIGVRDPAFEEWSIFERERLRALATGALTKLLRRREEQGRAEPLVATARRLLKLDPFQEAAHRALMRCYLAQGQPGLALRQYESCAETLKRELGVEPEEETRRVRGEITRQRPAGAPSRETGVPDRKPESAEPAPPLAARPKTVRAKWPVALAVVLLAAAVLATWPWPRETGQGKPSLVVLPFVNMSDDPEQEYFADGMTDELITDLTKISGLLVIFRDTAVASGDNGKTAGQVARELGVRYALKGSIRRGGDRVRINVRLIDAETDRNVWAESYDGTMADVIAVQDRVTARIVESLAVELLPFEERRVARTDTNNVQARDAWRRGRYYYYRRTPADNARAAGFFEQAITLDPDFSAASTALAKVYLQAVRGEQAYADELGIFWTEGYTRAWRLLENGMARPDADYHVVRSWRSLQKHQTKRAIAEARAALDLGPHDADALEAMAEALIYAGRPGEAMDYIDSAERSNPLLLGRPYYLKGLAGFAAGDPGKAVEHLERAIELAPDSRADFSGILAAAYGELGRRGDAEAAFRAYQEKFLNRPARAWTVYDEVFSNPRIHTWRRIGLAWAVFSHPFADRDVLERLANGFRRAGASEGIGGFLPLQAENRLTGDEIESILFGAKIRGSNFWSKDSIWRQRRTADGAVEHWGYPIHPGLGTGARGTGNQRDGLLCAQWPALAGSSGICAAIFRVPGRKARIRWGDYVMVTDTGPHPFSLVE